MNVLIAHPKKSFVEAVPQMLGNAFADHHILCVRCGRVLDVPELVAPGAKGEIGRWTGYTVFGLSAVWYGLCKECAAAADEPLADTNASDS